MLVSSVVETRARRNPKPEVSESDEEFIVLNYEGQRDLVPLPQTFSDLERVISSTYDFTFHAGVVVETEDLDVCCGERVRVSRAAWKGVARFLANVYVSERVAGKRASGEGSKGLDARGGSLERRTGKKRDDLGKRENRSPPGIKVGTKAGTEFSSSTHDRDLKSESITTTDDEDEDGSATGSVSFTEAFTHQEASTTRSCSRPQSPSLVIQHQHREASLSAANSNSRPRPSPRPIPKNTVSNETIVPGRSSVPAAGAGTSISRNASATPRGDTKTSTQATAPLITINRSKSRERREREAPPTTTTAHVKVKPEPDATLARSHTPQPTAPSSKSRTPQPPAPPDSDQPPPPETITIQINYLKDAKIFKLKPGLPVNKVVKAASAHFGVGHKGAKLMILSGQSDTDSDTDTDVDGHGGMTRMKECGPDMPIGGLDAGGDGEASFLLVVPDDVD